MPATALATAHLGIEESEYDKPTYLRRAMAGDSMRCPATARPRHPKGTRGERRRAEEPSRGEHQVLARNRKARHEYAIDETCEAGLALVGSEVKSIRDGKVALVDAYAVIEKNEAWLCELEIGVYAFAHARNHDPRRRRKLLLHRTEIDRLADKVRGKGLTLVPLSLYEKDGRVKVELALVHGKQEYDRRDDVKKREAQREIDRGMASRRR
jgi:SsrA-binding protein